MSQSSKYTHELAMLQLDAADWSDSQRVKYYLGQALVQVRTNLFSSSSSLSLFALN